MKSLDLKSKIGIAAVVASLGIGCIAYQSRVTAHAARPLTRCHWSSSSHPRLRILCSRTRFALTPGDSGPRVMRRHAGITTWRFMTILRALTKPHNRRFGDQGTGRCLYGRVVEVYQRRQRGRCVPVDQAMLANAGPVRGIRFDHKRTFRSCPSLPVQRNREGPRRWQRCRQDRNHCGRPTSQ